MSGFRYQHGDRPLEGYTIQRAIGRGGFGEVYYALSDAGREVAIKSVQGYEQVELRGVGHCMNLKSPHLVSIFDVRHNDHGEPFVIMEYVSGPSLRELMIESPSGLGTQKTAFFLREIAKGLTFLHDRGIVHRDLKPGNIFYEDGYVKIGDYGLSKAISASQHSAQTITVGTVHYMAPEIGQGRYDRSIDIYALGVLLYEMLTGTVPFFGGSHGEVLMKHLTAEPDLSGIEEPFAGVIRKAMAKDPAERYTSVQAMVEDVFGAQHVQESVSHFRPESLSMVADRVGKKVAIGGTGSSAEHARPLGGARPRQDASSDVWEDFARKMDDFGERMGRWGERFGQQVARIGSGAGRTEKRSEAPDTRDRVAQAEVDVNPRRDPLGRHQRRMLFFLTAMSVGVGAGLLGAGGEFDGFRAMLFAPLTIIGAGWGIVRARQRLLPKIGQGTGSGAVDHIVFGAAGSLGALLFSFLAAFMGVGISDQGMLSASGVWIPVLIALFILDWSERTCPAREERASLWTAAVAGGLGWGLTWIFDSANELMVVGILAGTSLAVQVAAPWDPYARHHGTGKKSGHKARRRERWHPPAAKADAQTGNAAPVEVQSQPVRRESPPASPALGRRTSRPANAHVPVTGVQLSPWIRALLVAASVVLFGCSLVFFLLAFAEQEEALLLSVAGIPLSGLCLLKALQPRITHWWSGLVRPLVMIGCAFVFLLGIFAASMASRGEEMMFALFLLVFAPLIGIVALFVPNRAVSALIGEGLTRILSGRGQVPEQRLPVWLRATLLAVGFVLFGLSLVLVIGGLIEGQDDPFFAGISLIPVCAFLCVKGFQRGISGWWSGLIRPAIIIVCGYIVIIGLIVAADASREEEVLTSVTFLVLAPLCIVLVSLIPNRVVRDFFSSPKQDKVDQDDSGSQVGDAFLESGGAGAHKHDEARSLQPAHPIHPPAVSGGKSSRRYDKDLASGQKAARTLLNGLGGVMLVSGFIVGLAVALRLPELLAVADPELSRELETEIFGYAAWPRLLIRLGDILAVGFMIVGAFLLLLARRGLGMGHATRAILGCAGLIGTLRFLADATWQARWADVVGKIDQNQWGPAIEHVLDTAVGERAAMAGVLSLVAVLMLVWPARRRVPRATLEATQESD